MLNVIKPEIIILTIAICVGAILLCYFISRIYKLLNKRTTRRIVQLPEYIENKRFVTSDQYNLDMIGNVTADSKYIILAVHDVYGNKNNFAGLVDDKIIKENNISVISFSQRNIKNNENYKIKNLGILIADIIDVIIAIKNKYSDQKLILLLEGFYCALSKNILKKEQMIEKLILVNPITNAKGMRFSVSSKIGIFFGFLFNLNQALKVHIDYKLLSGNEQYTSQISANNQEYYLNTILQFNRLNKKTVKLINDIKIKILIIQAKEDKFYDAKKFDLIKNQYLEKYFASDQKHYLFTNKTDLEIINKVVEFVNK